MTTLVGIVVALLCISPLALLGYDVVLELMAPGSRLGADPGEAVVHFLGQWTIQFLLAALSVSTLARLLRRPRLVRHRRIVGLTAFGYAVLHLCAYVAYLSGGTIDALIQDVGQRPYIFVGVSALLTLIPLAVTSTRGWQRRLGPRWKRLHRVVYVVGALAIVHIAWLSKASYLAAIVYGVWYVGLMAERVWASWRSRRV